MKLFAGAFSLLTVVTAACLFFAFEATQKQLLPINEFFYSKGVFRLPVEEDTRLAILTIDDAPSSRTPEILDLLSRYNAKATFFVHTDQISDQARQNAITKILSEGHEIGHHMPKDTPSAKLSENDFISNSRGRKRFSKHSSRRMHRNIFAPQAVTTIPIEWTNLS